MGAASAANPFKRLLNISSLPSVVREQANQAAQILLQETMAAVLAHEFGGLGGQGRGAAALLRQGDGGVHDREGLGVI